MIENKILQESFPNKAKGMGNNIIKRRNIMKKYALRLAIMFLVIGATIAFGTSVFSSNTGNKDVTRHTEQTMDTGDEAIIQPSDIEPGEESEAQDDAEEYISEEEASEGENGDLSEEPSSEGEPTDEQAVDEQDIDEQAVDEENPEEDKKSE